MAQSGSCPIFKHVSTSSTLLPSIAWKTSPRSNQGSLASRPRKLQLGGRVPQNRWVPEYKGWKCARTWRRGQRMLCSLPRDTNCKSIAPCALRIPGTGFEPWANKAHSLQNLDTWPASVMAFVFGVLYDIENIPNCSYENASKTYLKSPFKNASKQLLRGVRLTTVYSSQPSKTHFPNVCIL